jgi:hypothetical protein
LDAQKNVSSGEGRRKRRKCLYFHQLLFLLPHVEDRTTHSNLGTPSNENEEDEDTSREEEEEVPRVVRQGRRTKMSYEELLLQILQEKKKEDKDIDGDRCFVLSLLPSFGQFNDEQKILDSHGNSKTHATHQILTKHAHVFILLVTFIFKRKQYPSKHITF